MKKAIVTCLFTVLLGLSSVTALAYHGALEVIVNRVRLSPATLAMLEQQYRLRIPGGRYWYDRAAGLWGFEGGPTRGQVPAGLPLGGPLRADASHGNTQVFINGRELHALEVLYLQQQFGAVRPGRYWLNAQGVGGFEGGPPQFRLGASGGRRSILGHTDTGSVIGGDGITGFIGPDGSGVTCGPDGGCLYSR